MDIKTLIAVATGKIPHNYRSGLCPDELQPDSRNPDCPACKILTNAAAEHDDMERRLREAEKDAERYRWLRALPKGSCHGSGMTIIIANARPDPCSWMNDSVRGDDMDAAIDAALRSTEAGG